MSLTKDEIRMGDVVRLKSGTKITVDSVSEWYEDATGRHDGPWVTTMQYGGFDRFPLEDVVETVVSNPRICRFCGNGVTASNPDTDFCRSCYHSGTAFNDIFASEAEPFREAFPDCKVGFEHTGGGCWWFAIYPDSDWYWAVTDGNAGIPEFADGELWGMALRYHKDESHPDYEGINVISAARNVLTTREIIHFIKADMKEVGL